MCAFSLAHTQLHRRTLALLCTLHDVVGPGQRTCRMHELCLSRQLAASMCNRLPAAHRTLAVSSSRALQSIMTMMMRTTTMQTQSIQRCAKLHGTACHLTPGHGGLRHLALQAPSTRRCRVSAESLWRRHLAQHTAQVLHQPCHPATTCCAKFKHDLMCCHASPRKVHPVSVLAAVSLCLHRTTSAALSPSVPLRALAARQHRLRSIMYASAHRVISCQSCCLPHLQQRRHAGACNTHCLHA